MKDVPIAIVRAERFLKAVGLQLHELSASGGFGNRLIHYGNSQIQVRFICDRGEWFIDVRLLVSGQETWIDMSLLSSFLTGSSPDDIVPLSVQVDTLQAHWPAIMDYVSPAKAAATRAEINKIAHERAQRMLRGTP